MISLLHKYEVCAITCKTVDAPFLSSAVAEVLRERYLSYLQCIVAARVLRMRLQETVTIGRHFGSYLWIVALYCM